MPVTRRQLVYFVLAGFFLTNALLGELTGGKLFQIPALSVAGITLPRVILSIGVIPWPVVFITTDLVNEYFGKPGVRKLTFLAIGMICFAFAVLFAEIQVHAASESPVSGETFSNVFGQSMWIIVGSLTAFTCSQFLDVTIFHLFKDFTGHKMLWLRATGSTVVSQLVDTFVVLFIGFRLPDMLGVPGRHMSWDTYFRVTAGDYLYKLGIAVAVTPLIYLAHGIIEQYLRHDLPLTSRVPNESPQAERWPRTDQ